MAYCVTAGAMSLVDPSWEYIDPTPDIFAMFQEFDKTFFGGALSRVELKWSKRMTSCAGLMAPLEGAGGACSIRLSEPLLKLRPRKDLVETLLHEMIHAYLHVTRCRESSSHGPIFQQHMRRINKSAGTNITIYHSFHDEVNLHKQHWWRCSGPCRNWKPFYGWVKRATNRAPSKHDFWMERHQMTCGGQFVKVKEPENYGKKKATNTVKPSHKSPLKNGNILSMIKKKYNLNKPILGSIPSNIRSPLNNNHNVATIKKTSSSSATSLTNKPGLSASVSKGKETAKHTSNTTGGTSLFKRPSYTSGVSPSKHTSGTTGATSLFKRPSSTTGGTSPSKHTSNTTGGTSLFKCPSSTSGGTSPSKHTSNTTGGTSLFKRPSSTSGGTSPSKRTSNTIGGSSLFKRPSSTTGGTSPSKHTSNTTEGTSLFKRPSSTISGVSPSKHTSNTTGGTSLFKRPSSTIGEASPSKHNSKNTLHHRHTSLETGGNLSKYPSKSLSDNHSVAKKDSKVTEKRPNSATTVNKATSSSASSLYNTPSPSSSSSSSSSSSRDAMTTGQGTSQSDMNKLLKQLHEDRMRRQLMSKCSNNNTLSGLGKRASETDSNIKDEKNKKKKKCVKVTESESLKTSKSKHVINESTYLSDLISSDSNKPNSSESPKKYKNPYSSSKTPYSSSKNPYSSSKTPYSSSQVSQSPNKPSTSNLNETETFIHKKFSASQSKVSGHLNSPSVDGKHKSSNSKPPTEGRSPNVEPSSPKSKNKTNPSSSSKSSNLGTNSSITDFFNSSTSSSDLSTLGSDTSNPIVIDNDSTYDECEVCCPVCDKRMSHTVINQHLDQCLSLS